MLFQPLFSALPKDQEVLGLFLVVCIFLLHRLQWLLRHMTPGGETDDEAMVSSQVNSLEALIRSMKNSAWKESGSGKLRAGPSPAQQLLKQRLSEEQEWLEDRRRRRLQKRPQAQPVMRRKGSKSSISGAALGLSGPPSPASRSPSSSFSSLSSSASPPRRAAAANGASGAGSLTGSLNDASASAARTDFSKEEGVEELQRQEKIWTGVRQAYSDDTITCYHQHVGGPVHRFKYEVLIESDPAPVVAIARELDLMPNWHKFVSQSCIVENIPSHDGPTGSSFGGIWGYVELWFPWPLANRAMVVKCEVLDVLQETGAILVRLLSGNYDESKLPTTSEQCPRLVAQNLTQIVPMQPLPDGTPRTKFILFVDTDFQTNLIPGFVIQFILKVMAPVVYTQVKNLLETEFGGDTQFKERMAACPEMYASIATRVQAFLSGTYDKLRRGMGGGGSDSDSESLSGGLGGESEEVVAGRGNGGAGGGVVDIDGHGEGSGGFLDGEMTRTATILSHVRSARKSLSLAATSSFSDLQLLRRPLSAAASAARHLPTIPFHGSRVRQQSGGANGRLSEIGADQSRRLDDYALDGGDGPSSLRSGTVACGLDRPRATSSVSPPATPLRSSSSSSSSVPSPSKASSSSSAFTPLSRPGSMSRSRSAASLRLVLKPPARSVQPRLDLPRVVDTVQSPDRLRELPAEYSPRKTMNKLRPRARPQKRFRPQLQATPEAWFCFPADSPITRVVA